MSPRTWSVGDSFEGWTLVDEGSATPAQRKNAIDRRSAVRTLDHGIGLGPGGRTGEIRAAANWIEPGLASSPVARESTFKAVILDAVAHGRLLLLPREPITLPASMRIPPNRKTEPAIIAEAPTDWIPVTATYDNRKPYCGRYWLELPNGRVLSGLFNFAGILRIDGIPSGICAVSVQAADVILSIASA